MNAGLSDVDSWIFADRPGSVLRLVLIHQSYDAVVYLAGDRAVRIVERDGQVGVAVKLLTLRLVLIAVLDLAEESVNVFFSEGWHGKYLVLKSCGINKGPAPVSGSGPLCSVSYTTSAWE